jgi:hypothetical protein
MKASVMNIGILLDEITSLERQFPEIRKSCRAWLALQDQRKEYGSINPYQLQAERADMEERLMDFRQKLATIYDYMGDRGLVNFVPTGVAAPEQRVVIE